MSEPLLKAGLCPAASDALRKMGVPAERVGQVIGFAAASAGTHGPDGRINGLEYCAATDFRVRDWSHDEAKKFLGELALHGFAAYYRRPGYDGWPSQDALHIHGIYAGVAMKYALRHQIHDWLHGRDGLAYHRPYEFWQPDAQMKAIVAELFLAHNPAEG